MPPLAGVPVKSLHHAKGRLASALPPERRRVLTLALATHTLQTVAAAGAEPRVLAGDREVAEWAESHGWDWMVDAGGSLDEAASALVEAAVAEGRAWILVHADLPLLTSSELQPLVQAVAQGRHVLAASSDGGTSIIGGSGTVGFCYGPGSFHRHLARLAAHGPLVISSPGLAFDIDTADDLAAWGEPAVTAPVTLPRP
jgi:2-phospho-L-lactate guanylyltransferase